MHSSDASFKNFITKNGIIATAAGITIGFATATFFKSFVADMILPVFFMLLVKGTGKVSSSTGSFFARFLSNKEFRFTNFISELITWILIIVVAWLVINAINKFILNKHSPFGTAQEASPESFVDIRKMMYGGATEEVQIPDTFIPQQQRVHQEEQNDHKQNQIEGFVEASIANQSSHQSFAAF